MSWIRIGKINLVLIITILVLVELGSSLIYYQRKAAEYHPLATLWLVQKVANRIDSYIALEAVSDTPRFDFDQIFLNPKPGIEQNFNNYLLNEYKNYFQDFANLVQSNNTKAVVLWSPKNKNEATNQAYENFFSKLADQHNIDFISNQQLLEYERDEVFLIPYDHHPTRYANKKIALSVNRYIHEIRPQNKPGFKCENISGMFAPNVEQVWQIKPEVPYMMSTDKFGFRKSRADDYNVAKPVALLLGDSFTFGPYLSYYDTYPGILQKLLPEWNIINGAVSAFSIRSELAVLQDNISCLQPSLIVLQVMDNDLITGMTNARYNDYNFRGEVLELSPVEKEFYEYIKDR
jgi:hypothetical protein